MSEFLKVRKSKIPGAGKGLYTLKDIKKGERVVEYLGEIITDAECDKRAEKDEYGYIFYISKNKCIDAFNMPEVKARYANDANGLTKVKGVRNNCSYEVWKRSGWIKAEKNIKAGDEILVSYGAEYWRDIRYNIRLAQEKKAEEKKSTNKTPAKK